ncbi:hypothetical protein [Ktedonobacter racemifer]|uniref:Uncharacterized protein n=1 Tax=Ktedonobacter racemifer DSM 44963 TaxID=485913 RepID=D6U3P3_KTERA|nr:hypothetical protein [Ktedonobacter racemifer]EFH83033.1 hypothetical protein Krac_3945 [Ktedonobacter racemifer DSM 44963]
MNTKELRVSVDTVRCWRMRWIGWQRLTLDDFSIIERRSDTPRPGRLSQITAEQFCRYCQLAERLNFLVDE